MSRFRPVVFSLVVGLVVASMAGARALDLPAGEETGSAEAADARGVELSREGRYGEAEAAYRRALELDPELVSARAHLARLLLLTGREAEAVPELRRAATAGSLEPDLALKLAELEHAAGRPDAARRQLGVAADGGSVRALMLLSRLEAAEGDAESSRAALGRAAELAPNSESVLAARARALVAAGEPLPALDVLEDLSRMHPTVPDYPYLLGVTRIQVGDLSGAAEALGRAAELAPDHAATRLALGLALNARKDFSAARDALLVAAELDPANPTVLAGLAEAAEGLADFEEAERRAIAALALAPELPAANLVLGTVRMRQDRYEEARDALERAVAGDPDAPKAHYQLSLAYARLGDDERSRRHLELYRRAQDAYEASLEAAEAERMELGRGGM